MDISIEQEGRIIDYLKGNMTPEELSGFEKECQNNAELREEVEYYKDIAIGIQRHSSREDKLKKLLLDAEEIYATSSGDNVMIKHPVTVFLRWTSFVAAACVAVAIFIGGVTRSIGKSYDLSAFEPQARGHGSELIIKTIEQSDFRKALSLIGEYRESINMELNSQKEGDPDWIYELDADAQELDFLEAICFTCQGRYFKAKQSLKSIVVLDGIFAEEAKELLNRLPL